MIPGSDSDSDIPESVEYVLSFRVYNYKVLLFISSSCSHIKNKALQATRHDAVEEKG
jgi:hypothetical protein